MAFDRLTERLPEGYLLIAALMTAALVGYGFAAYLPIDHEETGKGFWQLLLLGGLLCLFIAWSLHKRQRRADRQIQQLLQAVENDDTAFRFPETRGTAADRSLRQNLNRIRTLLAEAKQATIQQEKYYSLILESVHTGVLVVGDEGTIYQYNREALRLLGREVLTHLDQLKANDPLLAQRLREARAGERFQTACHLPKEPRQLQVQVSEIFLRGNHRRILTFNDIHTELDEREIDAWVRLIRVLTHEIMNSVTPITSLSETLLPLVRSECRSEEIPEGLEAIHQSGKGLLAFVENYRRFTRIPTPQPTLFYVKPFLNHALKLASHQTAASSISFRLQVEPEELLLYADESLITQVVTNLLKNAEEALADQPNGEISVRAYADSQEAIYIEIANNGPAIAPEVAANLFTPFFTTKAEGSGIGLSLSRQLMRLSGGSLTLLSGAPVTFRMKFV